MSSELMAWWWRRWVVVAGDEGGLSVLRRDVRLERRREILLEMAARSGARGRGGGLEEDEGGMIRLGSLVGLSKGCFYVMI
jgi:hypothetical protein